MQNEIANNTDSHYGTSNDWKTSHPLLERSPPAILYHYTSQAGLLRIIKNRNLWASHIRFLNDAAEYDHAIVMLFKAITLLEQDYPSEMVSRLYTLIGDYYNYNLIP